MIVYLSSESPEAMGIDPRRHVELNARAVGRFGQLLEAQGIKALGNQPGILILDITNSTQRAVADMLQTIRASAVAV